MKPRPPSSRRVAREVFKTPIRERGLRAKTRLCLGDAAISLMTVSAPSVGVTFEDCDGSISATTENGVFYLYVPASGYWTSEDLPDRAGNIAAFLDWHCDGASGPLPPVWSTEDPDAYSLFRGPLTLPYGGES